ncbi:MAG: DUF4156 domain-containing protein [Gammaproteobacteria bacterium]|nr:DUF4156 domain-containing protein [Gammaproteobacteria bacterium]
MTAKLLNAGLIPAILLLLTSCTTVTLTEEGSKARVLGLDDVEKCQKTGRVAVSVHQKTFNATPKQSYSVAKQLQTLARNSAVHMGGDTVVAVSRVGNGQQTFDVFRCMP